jgi:hypothetical protein
MYAPLVPVSFTKLKRKTSFQNLASETAAYLTTKHPDYAVLAARIAIANLHKETKKNFSQVVKDLYDFGPWTSCSDAITTHVWRSKSKEWPPGSHDFKRDV